MSAEHATPRSDVAEQIFRVEDLCDRYEAVRRAGDDRTARAFLRDEGHDSATAPARLPRALDEVEAALATAFACAAEVSQLYHAPWLDAVRATRPGGLVLGTPPSTFAGADIAAYAVGIAVGIAADRCLIRKSDRVT